ncbi:MAG: DUF302 domain-containing protein, partial [Thermoanaerobaculia bacterium]|nr:DUF302 domain-containing protein [Thermoanaerobaculia bacterium]
PTTLVLFSNPVLGAAMTGRAQSVGIDLPHRFLVWQDGDETWIGWNDPHYLRQRHGISVSTDVLEAISDLLEEIATSVAAS